MTTHEIAEQLVSLCRQGKIDEAQATLFAENVVSIEAGEDMGPKVVEGLEALQHKSKHFQEGVEEFHGATISEPVIGGNHFAISWAMDATFKGRGRTTIEEVCVYKVADGKIISEEFFY
ncbi:MAG: hypothetical protein C0459_08395 [Chitinophaga sp.]|jgi:SnoaL-like domain|nr:hypothetical protein [Chitinophaga sp.]